MIQSLIVAAMAGAVASLLVAIRAGDRTREVFSKAGATAGFIILGLVRWSAGDPVGTWLVVGLVLCAVGDLLLLGRRTFGAGLAVFLCGHLAYIIAFIRAVPITHWSVALVGPVSVISALALIWLWPSLGRYRVPVTAYVVAITAMLWGALSVAVAGSLRWTVGLGAAMFYLSDLAVARQRFVKEEFLNRGIGLPLYYAGQVLIALSI
jgi:uncharacterized membrane protein YhhN